jgi:hypothetical protein
MPAMQVPPFDGIYTCKGKCAELVYDKVFKTAAGNAITACMGTVPGYWFTIAFVDIIGRINIQYIGVSFLTTHSIFSLPYLHERRHHSADTGGRCLLT